MPLVDERLANIEKIARESYNMALNTSGLIMPHQNPQSLTLQDPNIYDSEITFRIGKVHDLQMLAMRLRFVPGERYPFEFINCHRNDTKAFVFVVKNGQAVTLEDDGNMFPSDELVAKLRLLVG